MSRVLFISALTGAVIMGIYGAIRANGIIFSSGASASDIARATFKYGFRGLLIGLAIGGLFSATSSFFKVGLRGWLVGLLTGLLIGFFAGVLKSDQSSGNTALYAKYVIENQGRFNTRNLL